jgi:hypothetical protein
MGICGTDSIADFEITMLSPLINAVQEIFTPFGLALTSGFVFYSSRSVCPS